MAKIAILNTHPIQYYSPLYRKLSMQGRLCLHVFYGWRGALDESFDPGFGKHVKWDIPLLDGYASTFVENVSSDPGTHHFSGIDNPGIIDAIKEYAPDGLLVYGWNYKTHLRALRYFHGRIPIFFRGDSTLLDETGGPRTWIRRAVLYWVYRHIDVALYVGQNNRSYYKTHGLDDDQLTWVPHAIENERFADPDGIHAEKARKWRRELGIPDGAPTAVFAGKLESKKAPDLLLEAFRDLDHPDAHLVMAGSGPLEDQLQANLPANVHFVGFQNQSAMPVVYRLGGVTVLPSRGPGETWGLAINEAMACGRAVVASSRVGCVADLIDNGRNGFVFPSGNRSALSEALTNVLRDTKKMERMGRRSQTMIADWSIGEAARRTEMAISERVS